MSVDDEKLVPVVVRLAAGAAAELAEIERECNSPPWSERLFAHEFRNSHSRVYGARIAGLIVGFLVVHVVLDEAHIVSLGVRRVLRCRAIGRGLLNQVLCELHAEAVRVTVLEVRRSNQAAQELYRSLGFHAIGERPRYYMDNQEDAVLMSLHVPDFIVRRARGDASQEVRTAA